MFYHHNNYSLLAPLINIFIGNNTSFPGQSSHSLRICMSPNNSSRNPSVSTPKYRNLPFERFFGQVLNTADFNENMYPSFISSSLWGQNGQLTGMYTMLVSSSHGMIPLIKLPPLLFHCLLYSICLSSRIQTHRHDVTDERHKVSDTTYRQHGCGLAATTLRGVWASRQETFSPVFVHPVFVQCLRLLVSFRWRIEQRIGTRHCGLLAFGLTQDVVEGGYIWRQCVSQPCLAIELRLFWQ